MIRESYVLKPNEIRKRSLRLARWPWLRSKESARLTKLKQPPAAKKRPLIAVSYPAFAADEEVVKQHGQWWRSVMKDSRGALPRTAAGGVDAAIPAWTVDPCGKTTGKERPPGKSPRRRGGMGSRWERALPAGTCSTGAQTFSLAGIQFAHPETESTITKTIADTRRATTWKVTDGKTIEKARLATEVLQGPNLR